MPQKQQPPMSEDTKTILVVLLLLFAYPIGIIFMWMWVKWPMWLKILLSALLLLPIIAIFLAIGLIAINPAKQFSQANDTRRRVDINTIVNAVRMYKQTNGVLPQGITNQTQEIAKNGADICTALVPQYIAALPVDPNINEGDAIPQQDCDIAYITGYKIVQDEVGTVTVSAPLAEKSQPIEVSQP